MKRNEVGTINKLCALLLVLTITVTFLPLTLRADDLNQTDKSFDTVDSLINNDHSDSTTFYKDGVEYTLRVEETSEGKTTFYEYHDGNLVGFASVREVL